MHKVILNRIVGGQNLRTNNIDGVCDQLPTVGQHFVMFGEGLEFGTRRINTSLVKSIDRNENSLVFDTENSIYELTIKE